MKYSGDGMNISGRSTNEDDLLRVVPVALCIKELADSAKEMFRIKREALTCFANSAQKTP